ncbi:Nuclear movement protein nudc [Dictyocoela muelleri]|nr:Nuclear movement protein nudc [Dictyocoela muelleri]
MSESYRWSQEIDEINIDIDFKNKNAKDIKVNVSDLDMKIICSDEILLSGKLNNSVYTGHKDILWYIEDDKLFITLNKKEKKWWDSLFVDSEKIDVNEVVQSKNGNFDDLDDEAKQVVEKMMREQSDKKRGNYDFDKMMEGKFFSKHQR